MTKEAGMESGMEKIEKSSAGGQEAKALEFLALRAPELALKASLEMLASTDPDVRKSGLAMGLRALDSQAGSGGRSNAMAEFLGKALSFGSLAQAVELARSVAEGVKQCAGKLAGILPADRLMALDEDSGAFRALDAKQLWRAPEFVAALDAKGLLGKTKAFKVTCEAAGAAFVGKEQEKAKSFGLRIEAANPAWMSDFWKAAWALDVATARASAWFDEALYALALPTKANPFDQAASALSGSWEKRAKVVRAARWWSERENSKRAGIALGGLLGREADPWPGMLNDGVDVYGRWGAQQDAHAAGYDYARLAPKNASARLMWGAYPVPPIGEGQDGSARLGYLEGLAESGIESPACVAAKRYSGLGAGMCDWDGLGQSSWGAALEAGLAPGAAGSKGVAWALGEGGAQKEAIRAKAWLANRASSEKEGSWQREAASCLGAFIEAHLIAMEAGMDGDIETKARARKPTL